MLKTYIAKMRLFSRNLWLVLIAMAMISFSYMGIFGAIFNLYLLRLGYGPEFVGQVNGSGWLIYALACLPAGLLSRRFGVRRMMILGEVMTVVGMVAVALSELIPGDWQRDWIIGCNLLTYVGGPLIWVNAAPVLMASTGPGEQEHAFSVQFALNPLTAFVGNVAGGLLPGVFGAILGLSLQEAAPYRYALLVGALSLVIGVWALLAMGEVAMEQPRRGPTRGVAPYAIIIAIAAFYLVRAVGEFMVRTFFNVYMDAELGVPTAQIGATLGIVQLVSAVAALVTPMLTARWGDVRTVIAAVMASGLFVVPLALVPHWGAAAVGYLLMFAALAILRPSAMLYSQRRVRPEWRSMMSGAVELVWGTGGASASWLGGHLAATLGYAPMFGIAASILVMAGLFFWACFGAKRTGVAAG